MATTTKRLSGPAIERLVACLASELLGEFRRDSSVPYSQWIIEASGERLATVERLTDRFDVRFTKVGVQVANGAATDAPVEAS